jgi:hypothetical protein
MEMQIENIPQEMRDRDQWVNYRKKDKCPINPRSGRNAQSNNPTTWGAFDSAVAYSESHQDNGIGGIGFTFSEDDPYAGIDIDHCIKDGEVSKEADAILRDLNTYCEVSPSGTGIHAIVKAKLPGQGLGPKDGRLCEMYDKDRYFTVTGQWLGQYGGRIEARQDEVTALYKKIAGNGHGDSSAKSKVKSARAGVNQGARNDACASMAGSCIGKGMSPEKTLTYCLDWNEKNNPPLEYKEVKKTVASMVRKDARDDAGATALDDSTQKVIDELNKKHGVIMVGGKCCVLNDTIDPVFNRPDISFSSKGDFLNLYANRKTPNPDSPKSMISIAKLWWESPDRRQYDGLVFEPQKEFDGYYNLWRGFAVESIKGDWSLMERLIREVIADGSKTRYEYILAWMARIIQDPGGQRPGVTIVMRGLQGVGKGVFANGFGSLLGDHFLQVAQAGQVTGRFNPHLKDCVILFVDEGFWAGDKQAAGAIRNLVTEPTLNVEPKGKDIFKVKNNVNIIIASNSDWVVPAGMEERRFFTVDVSDCFRGDHDFFRQLTAQMNNGGREAMLHDLKNMDISGVNLRNFERTDALFDQILQSMTLVQKWWFQQLRRGSIDLNFHDEVYAKKDIWPKSVSTEQLYENFEMFSSRFKSYLPVLEVFGRQLNKLMDPLEIIRPSSPRGGPRRRLRVIPDLERCRKVFEKKLEMKVDWDDEKYEIPPF